MLHSIAVIKRGKATPKRPKTPRDTIMTFETYFTRCCLALFSVGCVGLIVNVAASELSETPNQSTGTQQIHRVKGWAQ